MNASAEDPAHQLADHLFRHESGRMVAILTGIYGARNLQLAKDVVQEALGELEMRRGDLRKAAGHFRQALALAETKPERNHLSQRMEECETT